MSRKGTGKVELGQARAGDIIQVAGLNKGV